MLSFQYCLHVKQLAVVSVVVVVVVVIICFVLVVVVISVFQAIDNNYDIPEDY